MSAAGISSLGFVDISGDAGSHVVVARGTQRDWQGHPNTLLLPDGRTMFCVWQARRDGTSKHGAPCGPLKRSDDGGLTWSELLDVPESWWRVAHGHPTIHRLTDREGNARIFVFARTQELREMVQAMSSDEGRTWTEARPVGEIVYWTAPQSIEPVSGGRRHLMWYERSEEGAGAPGAIWQSASDDGGMTWGDSRAVVALEGGLLCEPAVVRSPDGARLLLLMRENAREPSFYALSDDEGESWSEARALPRALNGDRHDGVYAPDGRLVIVFRDRDEASPACGHFVAWVGTWEDIPAGREGQYRVKLLHSHAKFDTGYPGIELLPDGTIVATTYVRYAPDELHSVVSVRFRLEEMDRRLAAGAAI
ncbi:MAG: sialidase family protein [Armatimonadota bacterium]